MATTPEFGIDHLTVVPREAGPDGDGGGDDPSTSAAERAGRTERAGR